MSTQPSYVSTALAREGNGIKVPATFREVFPLAEGDQFTLATEPGTLRLTRAHGEGAGAPRITMVNTALVPVNAATRVRAGIAKADIVRFDRVDADSFRIAKIRAEDDPAFAGVLVGGDGGPVPPEWLIACFTGQPDLLGYMRSGPRTRKWLEEHLADAGFDLGTEGLRIMDFGCGCGRVVRALDAGRYRLYACDLHGDAIDWCRRALPKITFFHGFEEPPVDLPDASIDFLFGISVMTHLDSPHQQRWLEEWRRIVRPGGYVFTTFIGSERVLREGGAPPAYKARIEELMAGNDGIAFLADDAWKGVFPEFYQTTVQSTDTVRSNWSRYFTILRVIPSGGFLNAQDAVIMRRD